jgi:hypothetical protein
MGKLYCYKLSCSLWNYNEESVQTGNTDIDAVETEVRGLTGENTEFNTQDEAYNPNIVDFTDLNPFSEGPF